VAAARRATWRRAPGRSWPPVVPRASAPPTGAAARPACAVLRGEQAVRGCPAAPRARRRGVRAVAGLPHCGGRGTPARRPRGTGGGGGSARRHASNACAPPSGGGVPHPPGERGGGCLWTCLCPAVGWASNTPLVAVQPGLPTRRRHSAGGRHADSSVTGPWLGHGQTPARGLLPEGSAPTVGP